MYFVLLFYIFYPHLTSEEMEQICQETDLLFTKEDLNCIDRQRGKRVYSDRGREQDYGRFWATIFAKKDSRSFARVFLV